MPRDTALKELESRSASKEAIPRAEKRLFLDSFSLLYLCLYHSSPPSTLWSISSTWASFFWIHDPWPGHTRLKSINGTRLFKFAILIPPGVRFIPVLDASLFLFQETVSISSPGMRLQSLLSRCLCWFLRVLITLYSSYPLFFGRRRVNVLSNWERFAWTSTNELFRVEVSSWTRFFGIILSPECSDRNWAARREKKRSYC